MDKTDLSYYAYLAFSKDVDEHDHETMDAIRNKFPDYTRHIDKQAQIMDIRTDIDEAQSLVHPESSRAMRFTVKDFVELDNHDIHGDVISNVQEKVMEKFLNKSYIIFWITRVEFDTDRELPLLAINGPTYKMNDIFTLVGIPYYSGLEIEGRLRIIVDNKHKTVIVDNGHIRLEFVHTVSVTQNNNIVISEKTNYINGDTVIVKIINVSLGREGYDPRLEGMCELVQDRETNIVA